MICLLKTFFGYFKSQYTSEEELIIRLLSQKIYERQLRENQICKPNILKLSHQDHWKNTENRRIVVVCYTKKNAKHSSTT